MPKASEWKKRHWNWVVILANGCAYLNAHSITDDAYVEIEKEISELAAIAQKGKMVILKESEQGITALTPIKYIIEPEQMKYQVAQITWNEEGE